MILGLSQISYNKTIRVSLESKSSLWWLRRALQTQHKGLMTQSKPQVSLSIDSLRFFLLHTMMNVTQQHPFFPAHQVLGCWHRLVKKMFFFLQEVFNFPRATLILQSWGPVTYAKYLLTPVSSWASTWNLQRPTSLCAIQRKYNSHKILVSEKQYSKDVFFLEKHPYSF